MPFPAAPAEYHCHQRMACVAKPLINEGVLYEYRCGCCGQTEEHYRGRTGHLRRWVNVSLQRRLAASAAEGV